MGVIDRLFSSSPANAALKALTDALLAEMPVAVTQSTDPKLRGRYDQMVDAMNRLPRPLLALGALVLVAYGMIDPAGFSQRMTALAGMPDALWWLLGAVITFTFGARETHYLRNRGTQTGAPAPKTAADSANAALDDWQSAQP